MLAHSSTLIHTDVHRAAKIIPHSTPLLRHAMQPPIATLSPTVKSMKEVMIRKEPLTEIGAINYVSQRAAIPQSTQKLLGFTQAPSPLNKYTDTL
jgi:hypothetical protein